PSSHHRNCRQTRQTCRQLRLLPFARSWRRAGETPNLPAAVLKPFAPCFARRDESETPVVLEEPTGSSRPPPARPRLLFQAVDLVRRSRQQALSRRRSQERRRRFPRPTP